MERRKNASCGCLLGLAAGDAMGYTVEDKSWEDIQQDYGPNGLLGYDLVNGYATGSAYTQVAAFVANGMLLGITRGKPELYLRYVNLSLREWARAQYYPRDPERSYCWVAKIPRLRIRACKDVRMLDALRIENVGTVERPTNRANTPGGLSGAVAVGLACAGRQTDIKETVRLGAQAVALTHGNVETFLCGGVLAAVIAALAEAPERPLEPVFIEAIRAMQACYAEQFPQAEEVAQSLHKLIACGQALAREPQEVMEQAQCDTACQCLGAAMYASLVCQEDFDSAMILAVNHSGRSAATGALVGAILGAKMGADALPDFYLECLELAPVLQELAKDLVLGSPTAGLFDDDWDQKYVQGQPLQY